MTRAAVRRAVLLVLASGGLVAAVAPPSRAQQQPPPRGNRPPRSPASADDAAAAAKPAFPSKAFVEADLKAVEDELAQYLQYRADIGVDGAARLELLIDLRVLARWALSAAATAPEASDLHAVGWFRANEYRSAAATLAEAFKQMPRPTPAQAEGMAKIHALTFALPAPRDAKAIDDVCRDVGLNLVFATGPLPPDVKQLPLMRPAPKPAGNATTPAVPPPATEGDPIARANALSVSPALKRQVVALATAAAEAQKTIATMPSVALPSANASPTLVAAAAAVDRKREDAATLVSTSARVLDMAEALGWSGGSEADAKPALQQQLADGLALFVDPRTRPAGQQRVAALDAFAQTVARVRRLNLGPNLQKKLSPAFAWAGEHPELGGKLMTCVEAYVAGCRRADDRAVAAAPQPPPAPREAKAVADAVKVAASEREAFLADVANLAKPGAVADVGALNQRADSMRSSLDAADLIEAVPKAVAVLLTFKPRPTGGLERRVGLAMGVLADPRPVANRDDAVRTLSDVVRVAELAGDAEHGGGPVIPSDVAKTYGKGRLPAFDTKRRDLVTDLVMSMAAGKETDTARVRRLDQMRAVRSALTEAAVLELALRNGPVLARWADWPVDPAELEAVFAPYRATVGATVEAMSTEATPPAGWEATRTKYAPAIKAVLRAGQRADVCSAMPAGWPGHAARLMTPLADPPSAPDRRAAFLLKIWARCEQAGDAKGADEAAEALRGRKRE